MIATGTDITRFSTTAEPLVKNARAFFSITRRHVLRIIAAFDRFDTSRPTDEMGADGFIDFSDPMTVK